MLQGKKIIIGITGSIAAYKIPLLVRMLIKDGAEVRIIMTPVATNFVTPLTLSTLTGHPVVIESFDPTHGTWNSHVEMGLWADLMLFAPVTANTLGKMVNGIADNLVITAYLSAKCPIFIAPAMDMDMYLHPSTQHNLEALQSYGNTILEPQTGELASGLSGPGRMEEPEKIHKILKDYFSGKDSLLKKKILITAGPTREKIDPVRFLSNFSSGKMGFELAETAAEMGAEVLLVAGPTTLQTRGSSIRRINVTTAEEMYHACINHAPGQDVIIMAAAVADYKVKEIHPVKIKKSKRNLALELEPTIDILKSLGAVKERNQLLVGFALETDHELVNAQAKLKSKNLDLIVLNSLNDPGAGFGTETNKVSIIDDQGTIYPGQLKSKKAVARDILAIVVKKLIGNQ